MSRWEDMEPWEQLAAKLADTGLTDEAAREWAQDVLKQARADERERIAQAIENAADGLEGEWYLIEDARAAFADAARIAREAHQ